MSRGKYEIVSKPRLPRWARQHHVGATDEDIGRTAAALGILGLTGYGAYKLLGSPGTGSPTGSPWLYKVNPSYWFKSGKEKRYEDIAHQRGQRNVELDKELKVAERAYWTSSAAAQKESKVAEIDKGLKEQGVSGEENMSTQFWKNPYTHRIPSEQVRLSDAKKRKPWQGAFARLSKHGAALSGPGTEFSTSMPTTMPTIMSTQFKPSVQGDFIGYSRGTVMSTIMPTVDSTEFRMTGVGSDFVGEGKPGYNSSVDAKAMAALQGAGIPTSPGSILSKESAGRAADALVGAFGGDKAAAGKWLVGFLERTQISWFTPDGAIYGYRGGRKYLAAPPPGARAVVNGEFVGYEPLDPAMHTARLADSAARKNTATKSTLSFKPSKTALGDEVDPAMHTARLALSAQRKNTATRSTLTLRPSKTAVGAAAPVKPSPQNVAAVGKFIAQASQAKGPMIAAIAAKLGIAGKKSWTKADREGVVKSLLAQMAADTKQPPNKYDQQVTQQIVRAFGGSRGITVSGDDVVGFNLLSAAGSVVAAPFRAAWWGAKQVGSGVKWAGQQLGIVKKPPTETQKKQAGLIAAAKRRAAAAQRIRAAEMQHEASIAQREEARRVAEAQAEAADAEAAANEAEAIAIEANAMKDVADVPAIEGDNISGGVSPERCGIASIGFWAPLKDAPKAGPLAKKAATNTPEGAKIRAGARVARIARKDPGMAAKLNEKAKEAEAGSKDAAQMLTQVKAGAMADAQRSRAFHITAMEKRWIAERAKQFARSLVSFNAEGGWPGWSPKRPPNVRFSDVGSMTSASRAGTSALVRMSSHRNKMRPISQMVSAIGAKKKKHPFWPKFGSRFANSKI